MKAVCNGYQLGLVVVTLLILAACSPAPVAEAPLAQTEVPPAEPALPRLKMAPEITNEKWINAAEPLTLASQRGQVVLLEFWTFG